MHPPTHTPTQLAGGLLSGRYRMAEMDKPSDGRFWTVGGDWAKKYDIDTEFIEVVSIATNHVIR